MDAVISILVWIFGIIFIVVFFPLSISIWLLTYPFDHERSIMHWWLVVQGTILSKLIPFWKVRVTDRKKAKRGEAYVIISNHQSILDIVVLNCLRYRFRWISKIENYKVPVFGWYLRMAKYITIDRGNKESKAEMFERSDSSLKKGISIMIFPEGTRSHNKEIGAFKLGAFQLALMTNKSILPVILDGTGEILPKHGLIFSGGYIIRIKVLDPVHPDSFGTSDPETLALKFNALMTDELKRMREGE